MDNRYKDNFLFFDEGPHKYTDTLGNEYRSVTTLIGDYYNHFNTEKKINHYLRKLENLGWQPPTPVNA